MATYFKSLLISIILFAVLYLGLRTIVQHNVGQTPDMVVINFINILSYLCWVISAYIFALQTKKLGVLNGMFLGICTLLIIIPANINFITLGVFDLPTLVIPFFGIGIILGALGGGIYDIQKLITRKTSNKSLNLTDANNAPPS